MHRTRSSGSLALLAALLLGACGGEAPPPRPAEQAAPPAAPAAAPRQEVELERLGFSRGSPDAPVTVVEFSDFGCPYCGRFALETLPQLQREFIESGQVRWQYVPFELGSFPNGGEAARAGVCAAEQDRFWPMHDLLYERQREWKSSDAPEELFLSYGRRLGLDAGRYESCYRENRPAEAIALHTAVAEQIGVRATPSFFINGRPIQGALPLEQFRMLLQWAGAGGGGGG